ncbi:MAG: molybdate ABC transporter substrate-binding protein [Firmicutes bacterium]|nr:molybdate ABC transporter substrate-binding protein [Bacillota bacterium]
MKKNMILVLLVLVLAVLSGCRASQTTDSKDNSASEPQKALTVAAASDLTKAFTEVGAAFEEANNCKVTFSFGSTGTLSEQIVNGAPFDVFASASQTVMDDLDSKAFIVSETKQLYALGRIGLVTMKNSLIEAKTMEDLLNPEIKKIAIANPDHAPYGLAAKQALTTAGLWETLEPKLVYGNNISDTLSLITTGNADTGFVALSLYDQATLNFSLIDAKMHNPLKQSMAVIKGTKEEELGKKFVEYVNSEQGREIMSRYGFVTTE